MAAPILISDISFRGIPSFSLWVHGPPQKRQYWDSISEAIAMQKEYEPSVSTLLLQALQQWRRDAQLPGADKPLPWIAHHTAT